jgi:hypothetical protein
MILASTNNLNSAIVKAKDLLEATSQKQASASLSLQESLKHQSELFEKLVSASDKLSTLSSNLSQSDWPSLLKGSGPVSHLLHPASLFPSFNASALVKVQYCTILQ